MKMTRIKEAEIKRRLDCNETFTEQEFSFICRKTENNWVSKSLAKRFLDEVFFDLKRKFKSK